MIKPTVCIGVLRVITGLVILLNAFRLFYSAFTSPPPPSSTRLKPLLRNTHSSFPKDDKPWPHVPSFRPWTPDLMLPAPPSGSCEAHFGNGFLHSYSILESRQKGSNPTDASSAGSFQCHFSETLKTSICEGREVVMNPQRISMAQGGELLETVARRSDEEELPIYSDAAFQVISEQNTSEKLVDEELLEKVMPKGRILRHTMRMLLHSMHTIPQNQAFCSERVNGSTLFVTRFEYANLFHTVTDWYSAYASSRVIGLLQRPKIVFLDGHCQSSLDNGWNVLFSSVRYAKHFSGPVCFEHAIFSPLGYSTALFHALESGLACKGCSIEELDDPSKTARLREFGEFFTAAFQVPGSLSDRRHQSEKRRNIKLLFIRREGYLAHPRHSGSVEVRLKNEEELLEALQKWALHKNANNSELAWLTIVNGLFGHMPLAEQVRAIHASSIIIGAHGAGLTHIIFSNSRAVGLEILTPSFIRPHYRFISQWLGLTYHSVVTQGPSVDCSIVVKVLDEIVSNIVKSEQRVL